MGSRRRFDRDYHLLILTLVISVLGGLGACGRYWLDRLIMGKSGFSFPIGTLGVNFLGATVLGVLAGLHHTAIISTSWEEAFGVGLVGGFTTFSTLIYESFFLLTQKDRRIVGLTNLLGSLGGGILLYFSAQMLVTTVA